MNLTQDRILGAMIGSAMGDTYGIISEFKDADTMIELVGSDWLDEFLPYPAHYGPHPLGVWENIGRRGVATDDTRMNQLLIDVVIENGGYVNSQLLAIEHIQRRLHPDRYYHERHHDLAVEQFGYTYVRACSHLGMSENADGPVAPDSHRTATSFPMLHGLINLGLAGLLFEGAPEKAYRKAVELDPYDLAYAKDATGMLAAMVSAGVSGVSDVSELIDIGLNTNPLNGWVPFGMDDRFLAHHMRQMIGLASGQDDKRQFMNQISRYVQPFHCFDPIDVLGTPLAALVFADGDPELTIELAANDRDVADDGSLIRMRDTDCTAAVAGVLVGAIHGTAAFPSDWVADVLETNRQVYRIDLEKNASDFYNVVYG